MPRGFPPALRPLLLAYEGMALHAREIAFDHPGTGRRLVLRADRPQALEQLLRSLRLALAAPERRR